MIEQLQLLKELLLSKRNPYHDRGTGKFTSRNGGGAAAAVTAPTKPEMSEAKQNALRAELEAGGSTRNTNKKDTRNAYHKDIAALNPNYKTDTKDGGAYFNSAWDGAKPPKGYPKDLPVAPRPTTVKEGAFGSKDVYKPPISMAKIDELRNMGPAGQHAARVIMHELYAHARARQGAEANNHDFNSVGLRKVMTKNGLSTINWEWHHNIPGSKGGSNSGKNMSLINGGEHTVAHMLEAALNPTLNSKGQIKPGNLGVFKSVEHATAARAQNNITKQLGSQAGRLRNAKYGTDRKPKMTAAAFAKEEHKVNLQVKPYVKYAIAAKVYKKNSKLMFNKTGLVAPNAVTAIRDYLLKNPIEPTK